MNIKENENLLLIVVMVDALFSAIVYSSISFFREIKGKFEYVLLFFLI